MQQAGYGLGILRFYQSMQVYHITSSTRVLLDWESLQLRCDNGGIQYVHVMGKKMDFNYCSNKLDTA